MTDRVPPNKQLQRTVTRHRVRAAGAAFHYAPPARWWSLKRLLAVGVLITACSKPREPGIASDDSFTLLTVPPPGVGKCERGPFGGDFMEGEPPRGSRRVALELGNFMSSQRSIRVILDSAGNLLSFRDELVYDSSGTSINSSVSVAFRADGSVSTGMEHRHESRGASSSTAGDRALAPERYPSVVRAARLLRERCSA